MIIIIKLQSNVRKSVQYTYSGGSLKGGKFRVMKTKRDALSRKGNKSRATKSKYFRLYFHIKFDIIMYM